MLLPSTALLTVVFSLVQSFARGASDQLLFQIVEKDGHSPVLDDEFAAWLEETGSVRGMKGVAIAVTRRNKGGEGWTTETKGFGVADRWGNPVDDETLFAIGSNSKLFTALGIGLLTANETIPIDWDTKIKDILPNTLWALQDPIAQEHADIVDILSHRTGLPRHDLGYSLHDTAESAVAKLRYLRPSAEFRQSWQYNNHMYSLGAHIISHVTGTPFQQYITHNIISPLDLKWTTYNITEAEQSGKLAEGFLNVGENEVAGKEHRRIRFKPIPFWSKKGGSEVIAGAGGIISNAKDMATWLQTLLSSGTSPYTNDTVIPPSVLERVTDGVTVMASRGPLPELSPYVYGMGQARYTYQGHEFIEHDGGTIGHYSVATRSAHDGLGVAIFTNSQSDPMFVELIKWRLLEKSLGLKQIDWDKRYPTLQEIDRLKNYTPIPRRPSNGATSRAPHQELAGVYFNPAYGRLTLCPYPASQSPEPKRKECDGVASEALQPLLNKSTPAFIATWPKIWATHALFHHVSGNKFDLIFALTFPAPFPDSPKTDDDAHPFAVSLGRGFVEFTFAKHAGDDIEHVEGIACTGVWGAGTGVKEPKGVGREGAEVWFDRVA